MGHRRETRKQLNLPATLCGMNNQGQSFLEVVFIHNISGRGALVEAKRGVVRPGDVVVLRCGANKARFKIIWAAPRLSETGPHLLGLEHLLPTALPWNLDLPLPSRDEYVRPRLQPRRRCRRFCCELAVEVRLRQPQTPIWSSTSDVGEGGCFLYMLNVLPISTPIDIGIWLDNVKIWTSGIVVSNVTGFGIGVKFTDLSPQARYRIRQAIESAEESPDRRFVEDRILDVERFAASASADQ